MKCFQRDFWAALIGFEPIPSSWLDVLLTSISMSYSHFKLQSQATLAGIEPALWSVTGTCVSQLHHKAKYLRDNLSTRGS